MTDKHSGPSPSSAFFPRLMLFKLPHRVKSKCSVLRWPDAQTLLSAPQEKKKPQIYSYTPHSPLSFPPTPTCTLLPRSSPRPEAKAPRHAQRSAGAGPTNPPPPPPAASSPSPLLSPFLLIIISVLNFQKHTRRENATVLPEQLSLCFQTAYYHQNGWIFSLSPVFSSR